MSHHCEIVQGGDEEYDCDVEGCQCVVTAGGSFTGPTALADCNAALANQITNVVV